MQKTQVNLAKKVPGKLKKLGLEKRFEKQKSLFIEDIKHPSLDFKKIQPKNKNIYSFRINQQYRARLIKISKSIYFVLDVGDFH